MTNDPSHEKEESERRKFALRLVFIVIIGLSAVVFILKFRQARNEVRSKTSAAGKEPTPKGEPKRIKNVSPRTPQTKKKILISPHQKTGKKLVRSQRTAPFDSKEKRTQQRPLFQLGSGVRLKDDILKIKGQGYSEVENIFAIDSERKDQYQPNEILYDRGPYTVVKLEDGLPENGKRMAYNHRTRRLGLITGQIILKFSDAEAYSSRHLNYQGYEREVGNHPNIQTTILKLEGDLSLEDLKKRESFWVSLPGIKAAQVEVLEAEILLK